MRTKIGTLAECIEMAIEESLRSESSDASGPPRPVHNGPFRPRHATRRMTASRPVNIIILDDYQDAVRKLKCASILEHLNTKVFTNTVKGIGQLSVRAARRRRAGADPRAHASSRASCSRSCRKLKLISQTGRVGPHIDVEACTRLGIAVAEGVGSPVAPAELTWALIMAAMRRLPQYISNAQARRLAAVGAEGGVDAAQLRHRHGAARAGRSASGATARSASSSPATARRSACASSSGAARRARERAVAEGYDGGREPRGALRGQRRALAAPAPGRRDARHRQARRALRA